MQTVGIVVQSARGRGRLQRPRRALAEGRLAVELALTLTLVAYDMALARAQQSGPWIEGILPRRPGSSEGHGPLGVGLESV